MSPRASSQTRTDSIVYELDTLQPKVEGVPRSYPERDSIVTPSKAQTATTEQCQLGAGLFWDGPVAQQQADVDRAPPNRELPVRVGPLARDQDGDHGHD